MSKDLVKRLRYLALDIDAYESRTMSEAADRIAALEMALEDATILARDLAVDLAATHYPEVTQFEPFESLTGLLSQIDNMTSGARREIERLLANAKQDAKWLSAYHRWCEMKGCAPSSADLLIAHSTIGWVEKKNV